MMKQLATYARPVLDWPYIRRTRRNHGLEHATIHMLNAQGYKLSGRSTDAGFVLFGDVSSGKVEAAIQQALRRMRNGEHNLAVHPNCGTNLVTAGGLTTLVALLGLSGSSDRPLLERLPMVMLLMMFAVLFSQPLGMSLQRHFTTDGDPGDLEVVDISRQQLRLPFKRTPITMYRVVTRQS